MKTVAVACGGKGTRLGCAGQKCLVEIEGRPFLHWKLDQLIARGADDIHLLVAYLADDVRAATADYPVTYHEDDGREVWAAHDAAGLPFVHWFTYGDSLLDVPLNHSFYPYVFVNDEHPTDAGLLYVWGQSRRFIPKHTTVRAHHLNTPADLEETRAYLRRHCLTR